MAIITRVSKDVSNSGKNLFCFVERSIVSNVEETWKFFNGTCLLHFPMRRMHNTCGSNDDDDEIFNYYYYYYYCLFNGLLSGVFITKIMMAVRIPYLIKTGTLETATLVVFVVRNS